MEVYGNISALKKGIEERYKNEIAQIEKEAEDKAKDFDAKKKKRLQVLKADFKTRKGEKVKEAKQRVLNEKKLEAKKEFELEREKLIQQVFEDVKKKASKIVLTKQYIEYVKKNVPKEKGFLAMVGPAFLKKSFPKSKEEKGLIGVKFVGDEIIYDYSINALLEAREDFVRHTITKNLFGE